MAGDIPLNPENEKKEGEVEITKQITLPGAENVKVNPIPVSLSLENIEKTKVLLLQSIQNIGIEQLSVLKEIRDRTPIPQPMQEPNAG